MKIAAISGIRVNAGGGFNQSLAFIRQLAAICADEFEFVVFTTHPENQNAFREFGIESKLFSDGISDRWVVFTVNSVLGRAVQGRLKVRGRLERTLIKENVDLAIFTTPSMRALSLTKVPFFATVWDLCHRDFPEFPEVRNPLSFMSREFNYSNTLPMSCCTICDSDILAEKLAHRYGLDKERLVTMPFSPAPHLEQEKSLPTDEVLAKYGLKPGYLFYPAKLWPHKNHVRILQAMSILRDEGIIKHAVFTDGEAERAPMLREQAQSLGIAEQVTFLDFVDSRALRGLYEGAETVVAATYFGPTNLLPFEAWETRRPLIYPRHMQTQVGDAAILFDADSAHELADAIKCAAEERRRSALIEAGDEQRLSFVRERNISESELAKRLRQLRDRLNLGEP